MYVTIYMNDTIFAKAFAHEIEAETASTLKCLERIPEKLYDWKPHEKSMNMLYLATLVAQIPAWITFGIKDAVLNFQTYQAGTPKTTAEIVAQAKKNINDAITTLNEVKDGDLDGTFELKNGDELLISYSKYALVNQSINHWVHHRGQLTVYMRLNNIEVPSIYGPSADDRTYASKF